MKHRGFDSDDRVQQVGWLRQEAQDILSYGEGSAEELVEFWESQSVEVPEWFDATDRSLLVRFVGEAQS